MFLIRRGPQLLLIASLLVLGSFHPFADYVDAAALGRRRRKTPDQRSVKFRNQSGRRADILWVDIFSKPNKFVSQSSEEGYLYGADTSISSFIGHEFEVREQPSKKNGRCKYEECRKARFKVNDQENQEIIVGKDFVLTHVDDRQRAISSARKMFENCKSTTSNYSSLRESIEAIATCMEVQVNKTLAEQEEERDFNFFLREKMGQDLIPYACGDVNFTKSLEMNNLTWHYKQGGDEYNDYILQVMHELPTSEIFVIDNFATKEDCDAVKVYNIDNQVPFLSISEKTVQGTILFQLATKLYELGKVTLSRDNLHFLDTHQMGYPLFEAFKDEVGVDAPTKRCVGGEYENATKCRLPGAEPLSVTSKTILVEKPSQLANAFLFCDEPKSLGALHFPHAGVHIAPKVGKLVMAINRRLSNTDLDKYVIEYRLCPNHNIYMHTFAEKV